MIRTCAIVLLAASLITGGGIIGLSIHSYTQGNRLHQGLLVILPLLVCLFVAGWRIFDGHSTRSQKKKMYT